jgi:hypothetical protein
MPDVECREVLACPRIDEVLFRPRRHSTANVSSAAHTFGSRTAVRSSPSAQCVWLVAQRTMITSDKQSQNDNKFSVARVLWRLWVIGGIGVVLRESCDQPAAGERLQVCRQRVSNFLGIDLAAVDVERERS